MVALSDLTFLARNIAGGIKNVAGSTITVALATLAEGLQKAGDITIRSTATGARTVSVSNTGGGTVTLGVSGDITATGDIGVDGNATVGGIVEGGSVVSLSTIGAAGIVSSDVGFDINDGNDQGRFRVANLTADRTYTFPDADVTIGAGSNYLGSKTSAEFNAITPTGFAWGFCSDIAGSAGGTTGVPVYFTPVTGVWLRYATDGTI